MSSTTFSSQFSNQFARDFKKLNEYELVTVHNKNDTYYLTRSVLLDSAFVQDAPSFFYYILRMDKTHFNDVYHSFAYL